MAYAIASAVASIYVIGGYYLWPEPHLYRSIHVVAAQVNAWQVSIGLLLLSVSAATTLAEERDRGSMEVIMTTPLSAREIVWGKWWGTIAMVPRLAILPIWVGIGAAMVSGGGDGLILMIGLILAYAAAITSFGLGWRPGSSGWSRGRDQRGGVCPDRGRVALDRVGYREGEPRAARQLDGLCLASPFYGIYETTERASLVSVRLYDSPSWNPLWPLFWIGVYSAVAVILAYATLLTFDRCMGRAVDRADPG